MGPPCPVGRVWGFLVLWGGGEVAPNFSYEAGMGSSCCVGWVWGLCVQWDGYGVSVSNGMGMGSPRPVGWVWGLHVPWDGCGVSVSRGMAMGAQRPHGVGVAHPCPPPRGPIQCHHPRKVGWVHQQIRGVHSREVGVR